MRVLVLASATVAMGVGTTGAGAMQVTAQDFQRRTLYHSPQTPGYTCWSGLWEMPDGSVMVAFTQITGPLEGWRQRAPQAVLERMPTAQQENPAYDMTGLAQENVYLRSTDGGQTWIKVSSDPFSSCLNGYCNGEVAVLADGTLLRLAWGQSLTYCDVRSTGFLQRSTDGAKTWGPPEYVSDDPHLQTFPTRLHRLRDGRLLLTGGAATYDPDNWNWMTLLTQTRHCLWVSSDPAGTAWAGPLYIVPEDAPYRCEEWDAAELQNGDLLAVLRTQTYDAAGQVVSVARHQTILTKQGDSWAPGTIVAAPFPHSGHPTLLVTREGPILHVAGSGISWTADRGATWTPLDIPAPAYYPHAVQLADGAILAVSHLGSDDPYGKTDQSIMLDRFRLEVTDAP